MSDATPHTLDNPVQRPYAPRSSLAYSQCPSGYPDPMTGRHSIPLQSLPRTSAHTPSASRTALPKAHLRLYATKPKRVQRKAVNAELQMSIRSKHLEDRAIPLI